jgi:2-polyprenyl-3-methyl-5-hydroxy-6-metoxy-1,4-benzoquinol methylase
MRACPICGTDTALSLLWNIENVVRCPTCGLAYADRLPALTELEAIYSAEYFQGRSAYADYQASKAGIQKHFEHRIAVLRQFQPSGDLFEAGCAYGFFLELAQRHWRVRGVDISASAIQYACKVLNLDVVQGDFESNPPAPNTYDVVVMWDTIEHLYDPVLAIRKCAEALRPGGILALTTGDLDARLPRLQKRGWRMIIPAHLYYFSRQSITRLLNDHGLEVAHYSHVGYYRSLRQMAQILTWNRPHSGWRQAFQRWIQNLPGVAQQIPLNLYDIMFVVAKKPASNHQEHRDG